MRCWASVVFALAAICRLSGATPWGFAVDSSGAETPLTTADASGRARLTDVPAGTTAIRFASGTVPVATIALTNLTLRFCAGAGGTTLTTDGRAEMFALGGSAGDWTFEGVTFVGADLREPIHYRGGAISCRGGRLAVSGCTFRNLKARFAGGAVCARMLDGDSAFADCVFEGNFSGPLNGTGGAVYATGSHDGVVLALSGCTFGGNAAQSGGAVSTACTDDEAEWPVTLSVSGGAFAGNRADYNGGALLSAGSLSLTNVLFRGNAAGVQGGAVCVGAMDAASASAVRVTLRDGTRFVGNVVSNASVWTCGGAIALVGGGALLEVFGREVDFEGNAALSGEAGYGGAVFADWGTEAIVDRAQFGANRAETGGGALFSWGKGVVVNVSVFSNNTVCSETGYGGAVAVESAKLVMSNVTVRGSNATAVDAYGADLVMANDLVAGNGETDVCAMADETGDVVFTADHCAYGVATVGDDRMTVVTNGCLSGVDESVYLGESLCLDPASAFTSVIEDGLPQDDRDYDGVRYGSKPNGTSIGAFECGNVDVEPKYVLENVVWYHCRSTGLYYPGFDIRFDGGNADRLCGVTLTCDGQIYELTADDVALLRNAKDGEAIHMGVSPQTFVQYSGSPENWGFVPPGDRLFGVADSKRTISFSVELVLKTQVAQINRVASVRRAGVVRSRSASVPVAARFADFRADERISGRVESVTGARIRLFGCAALGSDWQEVGEIETDGEGRFTAVVPEGLRFFRLEAEVAR